MVQKTLDKFGVVLNRNDPFGGRLGMVQPKIKHRFRVRTVNFGAEGNPEIEITRQVLTVDKPKLSQEPVAVHSYNSIAYYAGKHEWQPITLVVRDDIGNGVTRLVGSQIQKQMNHFQQTAFPAGINYKFETFIEVMDGGNQNILEQWYLEGCFLSNIDYDSMDYSSSDPQQISMTIRYDNAQYWGFNGTDITMPGFNNPFGPIGNIPVNPQINTNIG